METKNCFKCKVEKSTDNFNKRNDTLSGFSSHCKACQKINRGVNKKTLSQGKKTYYEVNKERILKYRKDNKETIKKYRKSYVEANKESISRKAKVYQDANKEKGIQYRIANKKRIDESSKSWYEANKDRRKKTSKIWTEANKEQHKKLIKTWAEKNKERKTKIGKIWRQLNPHINRSTSAKRRSKKLEATPTWISQNQVDQIKSIYEEAVELEKLDSVKRHIDHIHPLNNKYICGWHHVTNLQVLTSHENCSKNNSFEPYVESELDPNNLLPWQAFYPVQPNVSIDLLEVA